MALNNMDRLSKKLILNEGSPKEHYEELYSLEKGQVFKVSSDYETVMRRIEEYKPDNLLFRVFPINPGTSLYTMYGPDHCVVTENRKFYYHVTD